MAMSQAELVAERMENARALFLGDDAEETAALFAEAMLAAEALGQSIGATYHALEHRSERRFARRAVREMVQEISRNILIGIEQSIMDADDAE